MADHWSEFTRFGIGLFALLDPFTALPYVLAVASGSGEKTVLAMAAAATATAMFVLLVMHFAGEAVLATLGTSLPSFQIGGGLVILLSGLALLGPSRRAARRRRRRPTADGRADLARFVRLGVAPLGIPMLAGAVVASSSVPMRLLGPSFLSVLARVAGLVIVAVGVELMVQGVSAHARKLAGG